MPAVQSAVVTISSHVVRGGVGNRAAAFALERLGFPVWAIPTVILPWHPGHGRAEPILAEPGAFAGLLDALAASPHLGEVGAVLTGYLRHPEHVAAVARFVVALKAARPEALYLCDPVVGDEGGLYVGEPIALAIRDRLVPLADIATPNRYELGWLTGTAATSDEELCTIASRLGRPAVIVTSAFGADPGETGALLVEGGRAWRARHARLAGAPNGAGDLLAALYLARRLGGATGPEALSASVAVIAAMIAASVRDGLDELPLAAEQQLLTDPQLEVPLEPLPFAETAPPLSRRA